MRVNCHLLIKPLVFLIAVSIRCVCAQEATLLDEIVISGAKESTQLRNTPSAISKIGKKVLQEKKPTFVGQVLNQAAGVYVTDLGNEQHNMSIRQPLSYNALYVYLEDGIPIRPTGLFNHNALYEVNLSGVDTIEVIKGAASSLYGSNAVGGGINFFTHAADAKDNAYVGLQASNQQYGRLDFGASVRGENHALRLGGYVANRGQHNWQDYNTMDKSSLTIRHDVGLDDTTSLKNVFTYNRLYTDMPGSLNEKDYQNKRGVSYNTFTWRHVEALRVSSTLEKAWNAKAFSRVSAYARENTTNQLPSYLIFNNTNSSASGRITNQNFNSLGFEIQHGQALNDEWRWILGTNVERSPMKSSEINISINRDPITGQYLNYKTGNVRRDYEVTIENQALYSQLEYSPQPTMRWVAGLRYDRIGYDYDNHLLPSNTTGAPSEHRRYSHVSPKLGLSWQLAPLLNVYSNISQGFVPPEVSAQYGGSQTSPNLREATFNNVDMGARWVSPERSWLSDVSLYRLTGKDEVVSYSIAPGLSESRNAGKTLHQGLEFSIQYQPVSKLWDAKFNGAYAKHTFKEYRTSNVLNYADKSMPAAPNWLWNVEVGFKPTQAWRLSAEAQHVGRYWLNNANTARYAGHTLLNLRAQYQQGAWEWWMNVLNATNKKYAEIAASTYSGVGAYLPDSQNTYTAGAPRTVFVGVRYYFGARP